MTEDFDDDFVEAAVKGLIKKAWKVAITLPDPKRDPDLGYFSDYLLIEQGIEPEYLPLEVWEKAVAEIIAEAIVDEWERQGAPSVAKNPEGGYIGSAEGPEGGFIVYGETREEAEREARKAWVMRILEAKLGLGKG
jgi:hypothetical protein